MISTVSTISLRIDSGRDQIAGLLDPPAPGTPTRTPVLVCSPWGWDEVASYRVRREWARGLAAAGSPTLRFDLPAVGDSTGVPGEDGIVARWVEAVASAAARLDAMAGGGGVAVLGLGLGALLGLVAAGSAPEIAAAALWAMPSSGKRFVREQRAFSRMEPWQAEEEGDFDPEIPEGWLEAGGFCLSPGTLEELAALAPDLGAPGRPRRVLALDRDGVPFDAKLASAMEDAGVALRSAPGPGWGAMVSHPERAELPREVSSTFSDWLGQAGSPSVSSPTDGGASAELRPTVDGRQVSEAPFRVERDWGRAYGVLAAPAADADTDLCCVFLNAGAVRHVGPDRLWVEAARRWAGRGVPSLRIDLEGIGESDGTAAGRKQVEDFYTPEFDEDLGAALDALQAAGHGERFLLVGLCSGGYWAYRAAAADPRVEAAVLLNAGALRWTKGILDRRQGRKLSRATEPGWWLRLLRGEISLSRLRYFARLALGRVKDRTLRSVARASALAGGDDLAADLDRTAGTRVVLAFSGGEPLASELQHEGILGQLERWPNVELVDLPGADHTLRSPAAQAAAHRLLDAELDRLTCGP